MLPKNSERRCRATDLPVGAFEKTPLLYVLFALLVILGQAQPVAAQPLLTLAPVPTATLNVPAQGFVGENLNFTVTFDNTGAAADDTGYGPFIDLYLPSTGADGNDGIGTSLPITTTYLGTPLTQTILTFDAFGHATHPYAQDATGAYVVVTGTPGDKLVVLQLPFGSFTRDQPPVVVSVSANLSNLADVGTPLTTRARGGFQYGATPLNDWCCGDPSIMNPASNNSSTWPGASVTPTVFTLSKTYLGPEDETATGPNYPRQYRVTADVANGQAVTNLDLTDVLPNNLQFVSVDATTIRGTPTSTTAISTPSTSTPGGTLTRRFASVTGTTAANDAEMLFTFYVPLTDTVGSNVINATTGDDATSPNNASGSGSWTPIDPRDSPGTVSSNPPGPEHTLNDKSIAIQKSVAVVTDTGAAGPTPGDTLEYTLNFQVSDFFAFQGAVITDTISDGQHFDAGFTPTLQVNGNTYTLTVAAMNGANFTVEPHYTGGGGPSPTNGTTNLFFRVSDEIITRGQNGKLIGGCVRTTGSATPDCSTYNDGATTGTLVFRATILDNYTDN
jgi:fimbrial isopeptide formation D2 family protein